MKDATDLHASIIVAKDLKLLSVGCNNEVLPELRAYNDTLGSQVELYSRCKVIEVLKDELVLE